MNGEQNDTCSKLVFHSDAIVKNDFIIRPGVHRGGWNVFRRRLGGADRYDLGSREGGKHALHQWLGAHAGQSFLCLGVFLLL
jgi:hypothetical protein